MSEIESKQKIEIEFWRDSEHESPEADSIHNIVNKVTDAAVFLDCINRHHKELVFNGRVLELGGGQGWASCVYKKLFPNAHVTATDISKYAVMSLPKWERLFEVKIDNSYACTSYEINESDDSLDLIFCFAAAHHFLAHRRTLREISRMLKPGGKAIYFNEPATPRYLYSLARWRLERTRPEVPEDMLITSELRKLALEAGLDMYVDYYPSIIKRGPFKAVQAISIIRDSIPFLHPLLPCSANFIFMKNYVQPT
ncbi:MAG: class I SAM-dependent methyltransferase [Methylococcales bacterium]|nr:class I SAM-dependent methyltransferase [Methylococcales bacterium]